MFDHHTAALLQIAERGDELRRLAQPDVFGDTAVEGTEGVEVVTDHTEAKRHVAAEEIIGGRAQQGWIVGRGDVLQAHQRPVAARGARRERVEEHVLEGQAPVALQHEHERVLPEIRQISRADCPRKA